VEFSLIIFIEVPFRLGICVAITVVLLSMETLVYTGFLFIAHTESVSTVMLWFHKLFKMGVTYNQGWGQLLNYYGPITITVTLLF